MSARPGSRRIGRLACIAAAAASLAACASFPAAGNRTVLAGRVTYEGAAVPAATVTLYDRYSLADRHAAAKGRCAQDGGFSLSVRPGSYYVEARGQFEGAEVFAFSGQNPLVISKGERWLGMKAVRVHAAEAAGAPTGRGAVVEGELRSGGEPVEDGYVYVYSSPEGLFKGMGVAMSPPTGPDGKFAVENLTESYYYLVARRRGGGGMTGPLEKGDLYGFLPSNPVYLRDGKATRVRLEMVEKEKSLSYSEVTSGSEIVLRGKVVDRSGAPQAGVYAFVYDNRVFGHQRPYGHSGRTGRDGTFSIYLDRPGTFYLGARENFGNSPRPGERLGFYDGTPDHSVKAASGETTEGLTIVVDRVLAEGK
ncbi:MAG: carboxypeptidase-like regulatory domain-containing protein [Deltaproteobacteria bacterium]|nr:carboxypeptidase-like regulatory domain-containing protein [Deltaproteobacteria bacterium]